MPRFFFHFRQGDQTTPDADGIEFASVDQAYLECYQTAQDMWGELLKKRNDPHRCAFDVHDAPGNLLFTFPFQEVVDSCHDRRRPQAIQRTLHEALKTARFAERAGNDFRREMRTLRLALAESRSLLLAPVE